MSSVGETWATAIPLPLGTGMRLGGGETAFVPYHFLFLLKFLFCVLQEFSVVRLEFFIHIYTRTRENQLLCPPGFQGASRWPSSSRRSPLAAHCLDEAPAHPPAGPRSRSFRSHQNSGTNISIQTAFGTCQKGQGGEFKNKGR